MIKLLTNRVSSKEFFCETFWRKMRKTGIPNSDILDFSSANQKLMGIEKFYDDTDELKQLIKINDITFSVNSIPIESNLTLYRGISKPDETNTYLKKRFQKCINLKEGDIFSMPEYPFFAKLYAVAKTHAHDESSSMGIIYEVTFPKGTHFLKKIHYIAKRSSKFLCTGNEKRDTPNGEAYNHIKLMFLPHD